ncbi:MAG TPA: hypothetical protein VKM94_01855 [Blastocatellia bacterium]|nr:hypothetical protein [Blastocatellia bacterium]
MATTPTTRIARRGGTVRLSLPARVANDLASLQKSLKAVAERLGHPACATGCDILQLGQEQEFVFTDAVALNPQPLPPRTLSFEQSRGQITVTIPDKVSGNIDSLTKSVENVLGKLGCPQCCSGFDILFRREINTIALDEKGGVAHFGGLA